MRFQKGIVETLRQEKIFRREGVGYMEDGKKYLKIGEAADLIGVSTQTLRSYHARGILVPEIVFDSGHRKYSVEQVGKFIEETFNV